MAQPPLALNRRLFLAEQLVIRARIFYDIWWLYEGADTRPSIIDEMDAYSSFFVFDQHAHFVSFVVHMAALFEHRRDTINLPSLVREVVQQNALDRETRNDLAALLNEARGLAKKVIILRSNVYAHRSATLDYDEVFKMAAVTSIDLLRLCELAMEIVGKLLDLRGRHTEAFNPLPREDALAILKALARPIPGNES